MLRAPAARDSPPTYAVIDICHGARNRAAHVAQPAIKCVSFDERMKRMPKEATQMNTERDRLMSPRPVLSSLAAFIGAAFRPRSALARAIVVVLAAKLIAVLAMTAYQQFADQNAAVDAAAVSRLLGPTSRP